MLPRCGRLPVCLSKALVRQRTAGKAHYVAWTHEAGDDSVRSDAKLDVCNPLDSPRNTRSTCFVFPKLTDEGDEGTGLPEGFGDFMNNPG
ncbi:MAG: hypothetical protein AB8B87_10510 [Granulosicoccus sp.]